MIKKYAIAAAGVAVLSLGTYTAVAQKPAANMGFFVTHCANRLRKPRAPAARLGTRS